MRCGPDPYIQNHVSWCWATAAKITGFHILLTMGKNIPQKTKRRIIHFPLAGLRQKYVEERDGEIFVDGWQFDIVEVAKTTLFNPVGDRPEGDEGKERALKYVITGDPESKEIEVRTFGQHGSTNTLYQAYAHQLVTILDRVGCVIGNYQKTNGNYHSVVLIKTSHGIQLYDPWDGFFENFSVEQIFQSGFLSNSGSGIIHWIQYAVW